ncbi:hypothetical protein Bbelb_122840 [Branchiostoma belcheri]|nr:hypothetical protein Bbelb_122840 [Branchiostoma belcheri]
MTVSVPTPEVPDQQAGTVFYGCAYTTDDVIPSLHEAAAILRACSANKAPGSGVDVPGQMEAPHASRDRDGQPLKSNARDGKKGNDSARTPSGLPTKPTPALNKPNIKHKISGTQKITATQKATLYCRTHAELLSFKTSHANLTLKAVKSKKTPCFESSVLYMYRVGAWNACDEPRTNREERGRNQQYSPSS